ncbi:hypothetical protein DSCO28_47260 [Desulfosarcina ovata subsp. sediminis]|uniref:P-type Zn(2+) transporter n=1 Tax=Desulfosarcina ovata subsp. sediminis TaxID=885957 RepID=A0A5K7ZVD7_9BACT|nr:HAD-IC family P-type ATPase [Desulfosarcina ovata]BBO84160.1 hypothetical protein DSCO28_47260 [Desulfosarcina ovata subsp. sediminis]
MIGRYGDLSVYKAVFQSADFYRIMAGGILIPAGYLLSRGDAWGSPMNFPAGLAIFNLCLMLSVAINGLPIIAGALKGIFQRKVNVDELVSIAIVACVLNGNFFEAALISFIMVLGAFIEETLSSRARRSIESLVKVNPHTALIETGSRQRIKKIGEVRVGETAVVKAGEVIPVDGEIIIGTASIDESLLTGESLPVSKGVGDDLSAGTLNLDGYLKVKVKRTGDDATIGRILDLIHQAENSKVGSARIVDRYAAYFTPLIVGIAVLTYLITRDITRSIAVLVVGCPCSFLLAGPVATVAAVGRAAKSGIMVKGGVYLDSIGISIFWSQSQIVIELMVLNVSKKMT